MACAMVMAKPLRASGHCGARMPVGMVVGGGKLGFVISSGHPNGLALQVQPKHMSSK